MDKVPIEIPLQLSLKIISFLAGKEIKESNIDTPSQLITLAVTEYIRNFRDNKQPGQCDRYVDQETLTKIEEFLKTQPVKNTFIANPQTVIKLAIPIFIRKFYDDAQDGRYDKE